MKTKLKSLIRSSRRAWVRRAWFTAGLLAVGALLGQNARAQTISWSGGNGNGTAWTATSNWTGGVIPTNVNNAFFNGTTASPLTINPNPGTNLEVGSISVGASVSQTVSIRNLSTATNGTLQLYGVGGILLSNVSTAHQLIIQNTTTVGSTNTLNLGLVNSGIMYAVNGTGATPPTDGGGGEIVIDSIITGPGNITNAGPGILDIAGVNTYTGNTVLTAGSLELGASGTLGAGTLYFMGGNLESGGSRTAALTNPIVVNTAGNAYIFSEVAAANSTREFPLSGSLTGTSGTLVLANPNTAADEIFLVQLLGSFTFSLPLVVGDNLGDAYNDDTINNTISELQLANTINTVQTFSANISGDGPIVRGNVSVTGGTFANDTGSTIFTGNNTYTGGTTINSGTLFANNTSGSALGTGAVTVTNGGILAGTGTVGAPTSIYLNGIIQPGSTSSNVGNLTMTGGLTFNPGANYTWQISAVSGSAGTAWDVITCSSGWTDAGSTPSININVTSQGVPAGWNDATSYSWMIIANNGSGTGFNASHWAVNSSGFGGPVAGVFGVTNDVNGDLLLTYTPSSGNIIIDVESGSVTQGAVSPTNYPVLTGLYSVTKVGNGEVVMTNSLNSYQGTTFIDAGTASAAVNSTTGGGAFGASTSPLVLGNTNGSSNATLNIDVAGVTVANAVTVQSGSSGIKTIGTTITSGGATNSGNVSLLDNVTLSTPSGASELFSGNFSGVGGITLTGGGGFTMSGAGSYSGTTTLTGGALNLNASALGSNTFAISGASTLDNTSGVSVTLGNNPPQNWNADIIFGGTGNLNLGTGPVTMGASRTLTVSNNILTVGGTIAGTGFGLTLVGPGELALTAATNSTYTGGTTNLGGLLAINATATFGDGTGTLVLSGGGNLLDTGSRSGLPIANPVQINSNTRIYGNSTDTAAPDRYLPFTGGFTVTGGSSVYIDNIGAATTVFNLSLQGSNFTTVNWPIVIGDPTFDTTGALSTLNLINDDTTPAQTISGLITGTGSIIRGANAVNTGGTTILTAQNTFAGGVSLTSGAIGVGASSVTNGTGVVSGPLGTGLFTLGAQTAETNLTVFATAGPTTEIDNNLFINGDTNITFAGPYNLLFTGSVNSGGVAKTFEVTNGITTTFSGAITNTGSSTGGALTKTGGGILVFSGTSTYAGTTTVNDGTLLVNGAIGTNTVTVNAPGILGGAGVIGGNVTFADSGGQAYLYKTSGSPDSPLTISGSLTLDGNTVMVDLGGTTTLGTGTYTLINYAGALSGSFNSTPTIVDGSLAAGKSATIDLSTTNQVNLIVTTASSTPPNFSPGGISQLANGSISLTATGLVSTPYHLWASTNVALKPVTNTWTLLNSGTISASPFTNYDLNATNFPRRFYLFTTP